jgi:hypothetical protein
LVNAQRNVNHQHAVPLRNGDPWVEIETIPRPPEATAADMSGDGQFPLPTGICTGALGCQADVICSAVTPGCALAGNRRLIW